MAFLFQVWVLKFIFTQSFRPFSGSPKFRSDQKTGISLYGKLYTENVEKFDSARILCLLVSNQANSKMKFWEKRIKNILHKLIEMSVYTRCNSKTNSAIDLEF